MSSYRRTEFIENFSMERFRGAMRRIIMNVFDRREWTPSTAESLELAELRYEHTLPTTGEWIVFIMRRTSDGAMIMKPGVTLEHQIHEADAFIEAYEWPDGVYVEFIDGYSPIHRVLPSLKPIGRAFEEFADLVIREARGLEPTPAEDGADKEAPLSRKTDLEEHIRGSYVIIRQYEESVQTSDRPEEKARARRVMQEQWALIEGHLSEYRRLVDDTLPPDIAEIEAGLPGDLPSIPPYAQEAQAPSVTTGERGVMVLGDITDSIIITGDRHIQEAGIKLESEAQSGSAKFQKLQGLMPDVLAEMREDLTHDETQLIREFVILPNKRVVFPSRKKRFAYYKNEHTDLANKIDLLEQYGFVIDVTPSNTPIYRMTEEFVDLLTRID